MSQQPPATPASAPGFFYFVSYVYTTEHDSNERTSNDTIATKAAIEIPQQISTLEEFIKGDTGYKTVKLINFQFLRYGSADFPE